LDPAAPDPGPLQPVDDALKEELERLPDDVAEVNPDGLQATDWTSVGADGLMRFATPRAHEAARDFAFRSKPWEVLMAAQRMAVRVAGKATSTSAA
jgi:hypothetical protein